jgi:hypothetical protein
MNTFIVGAGFTKAVLPDAPLNGNLLDVLARQSSHSAAAVLRRRYMTADIEIALTRLDSDIAAPKTSGGGGVEADQRLRRKIETELGKYFTSFVASEDLLDRSPWFVQFIQRAFSSGDVVISLNYDCLLEGALDCCGKWSPKGGYGSPFDQPLVRDDEFSTSPITVLKIHGSASFVIAPYLDRREANAVNFTFDEHFFPRSAKNTHFQFGGGTGRAYLIAPSFVKVSTVEITYLMLDALEASSTATNLVIIGSALRPEDAFLTVILTNFLRQPTWRTRKIFIIDPVASTLSSRLQTFWGVDVSAQIVPMETGLQAAASPLVKALSEGKSSSSPDLAR